MTQLTLEIKRLSPDAKLPTKAHETDSGFDLYANEDVVIGPGETVIVKTGISVKLPPNHEATVRPRSGVTSRTKLRVQLGTIDNGYNGEIGVITDNTAPFVTNECGYPPLGLDGFFIEGYGKTFEQEDFYVIRKGDKLAQLVVTPVALPQVVEVDELDETERGDSGYGASGVR